MATNGVCEESQAQFAALLRYFHRGDFTAFARACELAFGSDLTSQPYFCQSLLLAAQVSGLCEVSVETGATKWWVAFEGDISVRSIKPKQIGVAPHWFEAHRGAVTPLIRDSDNRPLILGRRVDGGTLHSAPGLYSERLVNLLPPFKDIESQLCISVPFVNSVETQAEAYCPADGTWEPATPSALKGPRLVRARRAHAGFSFYVQHAELSVRVQITQPEWAFVVAYILLPWRASELLHVVADGDVRVRRTVRLPALISRLLFAGADELVIGPWVTFKRVDDSVIAGIFEFLSQGGMRR